MRTINKGMIAVMVTLTLCLTPLFVIEDSEAVIINKGEAGLSFDASSISDSDLDRLITADSKNQIALIALRLATDPNTNFDSNAWTLSDVKITGMKNMKDGMGTKYTSSSIETFEGSSFECEVSFTATVKEYYSKVLFCDNDGNQELYNFISTATAASNSVFKIKGTLTHNAYTYSSTDYFMTNENKGCVEKEVNKNSELYSFSGTVNGEIYKGGNKLTRDYTVDASTSGDARSTITYDYGNVKEADVKGATQVIVNTCIDKNVAAYKFKYTTNDNKNGGYEYSIDQAHIRPAVDRFAVSTADDFWIIEDQTLPEYRYYGNDSYCLFSNAGDPELRNNTSMESFLKGLRNCTVSDSYSDVKSVAESASVTVDGDNVPDSKGNLVFYIIIGALAIVIVLLVILMLRKKKEPKQEDQ